MGNLTFRKKVLLSYILLFFLFALLLYPLLFSIVKYFLSGNLAEDHQILIHKITFTFYLFSIGLLIIFGIFAHVVFHYMAHPIKSIIQGIREHELGKPLALSLGTQMKKKDEFGILASKLTSFAEQIEKQMANVLHEKNEKEEILETLVEGVLAIDENQIVIYANNAALDFLKLSRESIVGKDYHLLRNLECSHLIDRVIRDKKSMTSLIRTNRKPRKYLDVMAIPRSHGGVILVLQDKTSLHKIVEQGRDFIANASHELKTPITIIRGFAETLHEHPELTKEVSKEITQKIVANCNRMETLVRNLLTLAALDEGIPSSRVKECDLFDLAERAKMTILNVHPAAQISIVQKGQVKMRADSDLLFQAILNLLDNAAKYSKPPAKITVLIEQTQEKIHISIQDEGIGIPPQEIERIFERFYAVDKSHSRSLGGSGLGLSIVESIIEKHQGHIEVESKVGVGTIFHLYFQI